MFLTAFRSLLALPEVLGKIQKFKMADPRWLPLATMMQLRRYVTSILVADLKGNILEHNIYTPRVIVKALIVAELRSRKTKKSPVKTGLTLRKYFWG